MKSPGSVDVEQLQQCASGLLLPMLWYGLFQDVRGRCRNAGQLLCILDSAEKHIFEWQFCDIHPHNAGDASAAAGGQLREKWTFQPMHSAAGLLLENHLLEGKRTASLQLPPPLDLNFDISDVLTTASALGRQTQASTGKSHVIRRILKASVLLGNVPVPVWQEMIEGRWRQCAPARLRSLEVEFEHDRDAIDFAAHRRLLLQNNALCGTQLPFASRTEPYCAPAAQADIEMMQQRLHESLPEWDVTDMQQVVNEKLGAAYASYRLVPSLPPLYFCNN